MYDPGPTDAELQAIGLSREDVEDNSDVEVWPENWVAFKVFNKVSTQWRMGPGGPTGLDYNPLFSMMKCMKVKPTPAIMDRIRVLESTALSIMSKS